VVVNVLYYVFAAGALGGAVAVAASRNIVRSAFALLAVLVAVAALYALLKADFIAAAQVLIYVGGILVLIIFAVMLTHRITDVNLSNESTPGPAAFCACLCLLFALVVVSLFTVRWKREADPVTLRVAGTDAAKGEYELTLRQYQADGRTGLVRGGVTFEDRVVLQVAAAPAPPKALEVRIVAKAEGSPDVEGSGPVEGGAARVELRGLQEKPYRWTAVFLGAGSALTADTPLSADPDFVVAKGLTKPAARALMGPYLLAFEVVSVLLLAALVGAAFLARKEVKS
jgi:NADH-quinone oxidoreductase subunit J